jgi:sugar phosphate isomerase/epimerase
MLGISTCWWDTRSFRGDEIVGDILELGFEGVELEYRITNSIYQQMRPHLNKQVRVLSIHNFFPKPEDPAHAKADADLFLLSSPDKEERSRAVAYTIRTIEHASDLEAQAVILHLGRVDMANPKEGFVELYQGGKIDGNQGEAFLKEQTQIRQAKRQKNLDAVLFSLEKLNREAEHKGVLLGIENRYHFHEIPNFEEIGIILGEFVGGAVRYWHDVGHAAVHEQLGISRHKDLLDAYSGNMIGIHFHDAKGLDDHLAPGQGEIDYAEITPFLKPTMAKILEIHPKVEREDLLEGAQVIKAALNKSTAAPAP